MMRRAAISAFLAMLAGAALAQSGTLPVAVGGSAETDACTTQAAIAIEAEGVLPVRVGPGEEYEQFGEVKAGEIVNVCDESGPWVGIVYGKKDCGVAKPIETRQAYVGGCSTGWVPRKAIDAVAG